MIGEQGLSHRHFYVNTPVCCPSRTEFLSGRYHHNVRDSKYLGKQGCGDEDVGKEHTCDCMRVNSSTMLFEETTYADYLQQAGYTTAYFGKYLNPPAMDIFCSGNGTKFPGWDHFMGMCNTAYYDITWNMDGALIKTGKEPHEYSTSIVGNKTIEFLHQHMNTSSERPFLVVAATRAPHKPQTPAPWYKDALPGTKNRKTPAFNCSVTGKVPWVARQKPIDSSEDTSYDTAFRQRWQTLLSVDDLVEGVVQALDELDLMPKTYFIFSSDHGYHLGHMRLSPGKRMHYEFDTRVPFLIRGPKIAANVTATFIAGNVDMAPTFLELAGWRSSISPLMFQKPARMDGRSFAPMLLGSSPGSFAAAAAPSLPAAAAATSLPALARTHASAPPVLSSTWRDHFLLEFTGLSPWHGGRINDCPNNTYRALRFVSGSSAGNSSAKANAFENMPDSSGNMLYVEMTTSTDWWYDQINFRELYDMDKDPYQLINIFDNAPAATKQALATQMATEWECKGVDCP
jgi:arylsulfatase A-like enzyme